MTPSDPNASVRGAASAPAREGDKSPARRRRQWTDAEKAEYLALFAESGLPSATFCREMEIPEATLWLWRRQAREATPLPPVGDATEDATEDAADRFAAVQVVDAAPARPSGRLAAGVTLTLRWPTGLEAQLAGLEAPLLRMLLGPLLREVAGLAPPGR